MGARPAPSRGVRFQPQGRAALGAAILALGSSAVLAFAYALGARGGEGLDSGFAVIALGGPAIAATGWLAWRHATATVVAILLLMSFSGTLDANYGVFPIKPMVWLFLLGLVAATWFGFFTRVRRGAVSIWPGIAALGAYLLFTFLEMPFAETPEIGARAFAVAPALAIGFFAFAYADWDRETRWRIVRAFTLVGLVVGAYAAFRLIVGPTGAEQALARRSAGVGGDLALFGSFGNRVELGAWTGVMAPFLFALALALRGRWRWISTAALALVLVALLGSEVRTALLGAAAGILLVAVVFQGARAFRNFRLGTAAFGLAGMAALGAMAFAFTLGGSPASTSRFEKILDPGSDFSFQHRTQKWNVALSEINSHPFGEGLGTAGSTQRQYSHVYRLDNLYIDNSWLQLGVQQGYPGLILFGTSAVLILYMLARSSLTTSDPRNAAAGIGAIGALVAWLVTLMTGNILESWSALLVWMLLGLGVNGFLGTGSRIRS